MSIRASFSGILCLLCLHLFFIGLAVLPPVPSESHAAGCSEWNSMGLKYHMEGRYSEASGAYTRCIQECPDFFNCYKHRGDLFRTKGKYDLALEDYRKLTELEPDSEYGYRLRAEVYYIDLHDFDAAYKEADKGIKAGMNPIWSLFWRGEACLVKGCYETTINDLKRCMEIEMTEKAFVNIPLITCHIGMAYSALKKYNEALTWLLNAFDLLRNEKKKTDLAMVCNNIAWIMATCPDSRYRNGYQALLMAREAFNNDSANPGIHDTLAAAYAESGRFKEAVREQEKAIDMLTKMSKPGDMEELLSKYKGRLKLYRGNKPFRDGE